MKIYYPKRFEALRRFYCGKHDEFLKSIFRVNTWAATGGKAFLGFYKTHDEKYLFKEVKAAEFKMFLEFGQTYFEYMSKSFFKNYPSTLAKILGAYIIKVSSEHRPDLCTKKYILLQEDLNLGVKENDESQIIRYDLKGSQVNRLVITDDLYALT